jgi:two-component system, OmpR family, sensor kinase
VAGGDLNARVNTVSPDPEVAQLGMDLDAMIEQLSTLMNAQRRFIAHAAHELRSPLAALYGELQQALRKPRDVDGYCATIQQSLLAARRLNQLADDLLTLARPGSADGPPTSVAVAEVVAEAVALVRMRAVERSVHLQIDVAAETVVGRPRDLQRMLRNLIENAIDHTPRGDVVQIAASRCHDTVQISVEDRGPGIAADERERIFEPFYRSAPPPDGARRGAGLGLAIAREIARAHGGDIRMQDAPGQPSGARFIAAIPCLAELGPVTA